MKKEGYYHLKGVYEGGMLGVFGNFFVSSFFNLWNNQTLTNALLCLISVFIFGGILFIIKKDISRLMEVSSNK